MDNGDEGWEDVYRRLDATISAQEKTEGAPPFENDYTEQVELQQLKELEDSLLELQTGLDRLYEEREIFAVIGIYGDGPLLSLLKGPGREFMASEEWAGKYAEQSFGFQEQLQDSRYFDEVEEDLMGMKIGLDPIYHKWIHEKFGDILDAIAANPLSNEVYGTYIIPGRDPDR